MASQRAEQNRTGTHQVPFQMLRKRAPNPSFPWHRAHLFIFLPVGRPAQRVFRRTLASCLRCTLKPEHSLHLKRNGRLHCFWTMTRVFWTTVYAIFALDNVATFKGREGFLLI